MNSINLYYEGDSKNYGLERLSMDLHRSSQDTDPFKLVSNRESVPEIEILEKISTFDKHDFHFKWSLLIFLCNIYNFFTVPYFLAISSFPSGVWLGLELFFEFILLADLLGRLFFHKSMKSRSFWLLQEEDSMLTYLFFVISSLPYSFFSRILNPDLSSLLPSILRSLKTFRYFQFRTFFKNADIIRTEYSSYILESFKLLLVLLACVHYLGCFWIFVARIEDSLGTDHWTEDLYSAHAENWEIYTDGLFWSAESLTGIIIESSKEYSTAEVFICVFVMIVGAVTYAIIFGRVTSILERENLSTEINRRKMDNSKMWNEQRKVPNKFKKRIVAYFKYAREKFSNSVDYSFIDELPLSLRTEISIYMYQDLIHKVKLFELGDPSFMMAIIRHLKPRLYMQNDFVIRRGDYANEFYIIRVGTVEVLATDDETQIALLDEGCYFGEIGLLLNVYRTVSVRACKACIICYISKDHFLQVVKSFPEHNNFLLAVAEQRKRCMHVADFDKTYDLTEDFSSDESDDSEDLEPPKFFTAQEHKKKKCFKKFCTVERSNAPSTGFIIDPLSYFYYLWTLLLTLSYVFYLLYVPFSICFENEGGVPLQVLNLIAYVIYCVDVGVNLFTAIITEFGNYAHSKEEIRRNYIKVYLMLDIFSLVPFDFLFVFVKGAQYIPAYLRLLRLFKSRRVFHMWKVIIRSTSLHYSSIRLILIFLILVYLSHLYGCLFLYVAKLQYFYFKDSRFDSSTFITSFKSGRIGLEHFLDESSESQYIIMIYIGTSVISTAAYGDLYPVAVIEKMFCLALILLARLLIAILYAESSTLNASLNANYIRHINKVRLVKKWAKITQIPKSLNRRILGYYNLLWNKLKGYNDEEIIDELPEALRTDISYFLFKGLTSSGLFPVSDSGAILSIVRKCKVVVFCANETIITEGELGLEMFFIMEGRVKVVTSLNVVLNRLGPGSFFGEMSIIKPVPDVRLAGVVAETDSTLAMLSLDDYKYVAGIFPEFADKVTKQAAAREGMNRSTFSSENIEALRQYHKLVDQFENGADLVIDGIRVDDLPQETTNEGIVTIKVGGKRAKIWSNFTSSIYLVIWIWNMMFIPFKIAFSVKYKGFGIFMESLTMLGYSYFVYEYITRIITKRRNDSYIEIYAGLIQHILLTFPFLLISDYTSMSSQAIGLFSLFRISNFYLIFTVFFKLKQNINWFISISFIEILSIFFLLNHFLGCYYIFIGKQSPVSDSWIGLVEDNVSDFSLYIYAFYWANSTLSHSSLGDIYSINQSERIYNSFAFILTCIAYAFLFGSISSLWSGFASQLKSNLQESYNYVKDFLRKKKVENLFSGLIDDYYNYIWHTSQGIQESKILKELPHSIRSSLQIHRYSKAMMASQVFKDSLGNVDYNIALSIFRIITIQHYLVGDAIIKVGDKSQDMYVILEGEVDVLNIQGKKVLATLREGAHFGEANIILKNEMRTATIIATKISKIGILTKKDLEILFEAYPEWYKKLEDIVKNRMKQTFNTSNREDVSKQVSTISQKLQSTPSSYKKYTKRSEKLMASKIAELLAQTSSGKWMTLNFVHLILIIYSTISIPLFINFEINGEPALISMEALVLTESFAYFCLNLRDSYRTTRVNNMHCKKSLSLFYKNFLIEDFFSCSPFNLLFVIVSVNEIWLSIPLRCLRFVSLSRVNSLFEKMEMYDRNLLKYISLFKVLFVSILVVHWSTCAWIFITARSEWQTQSELDSEGVPHIYEMALYYVMNIISGSGHNNTKPYSDAERVFTVFLSIIGFGVFASSFGMIASISSGRVSKHQETIQNIHSPFNIKNRADLPSNIYSRLQQYCAFSSGLGQTIGPVNFKSLYNHLPPNIVGTIIYECNRSMLKKLPFLAHIESDDLAQRISLCLSPQIYLPNDYIIYKNDVGEEMFFIILGMVNIIAADNHKILKTLKKGEFFGEAALLTDSRRMCSVRSSGLSLIYALNKNDFTELLKDFPELEAILNDEVKKRNMENKIINQGDGAPVKKDIQEDIVHTLNMYSTMSNPFFNRKNSKRFTILAGMKHYDKEVVKESYGTDNLKINKRRPMIEGQERRMSQEILSKEILLSKVSKYARTNTSGS